MEKIGLGGGCHWCTEAVFLSLRGVLSVEQGWISAEENISFSEAVVVHYDPAEINLSALIAVHLHTHSSTVNHSMRNKYRSAVYVFNLQQHAVCAEILMGMEADFDRSFVTKIFTFHSFRPSNEEEQDYYYKGPSKPFCKTHIHPKLKILLNNFPGNADAIKINRSISADE
ncbi:MAG: peptide-methionine (S)-S-oxide reductase [Bacteroidota bacterium]